MGTRRKLLFVDRDGAVIEPSVPDLRLVRDVIPALLRVRDAGYELVMVGRGGGPHEQLMQLLASQGICFAGVHVDARVGALLDYLRNGDLDAAASAAVGDGASDLAFAGDLGVRALRLGVDGNDWTGIAHRLADAPRIAQVARHTRETRIDVAVDLDREAAATVSTGLGFFDHMLEQLGRHGGFALTLRCEGDTRIDEHHTVEDSALALGDALRQALGDKRGIGRYGFSLPMDETRAEALLDLSGRAYFVFEGRFERERVGELPTELVPHFFRSLSDALGANLHLKVAGDNTHHMVEACFKVVARALRMAIRREGRELPSTKGKL